MQPIQHFATRVLAGLIQRQPASNAKTAFAWQLAVGPALARVTTVELEDEVLVVRAADHRWLEEIQRATHVVLPRIQQLLGSGTVIRIETRRS